MLEIKALPYYEGRLLILVPSIRQGKCFFCVLACCMGSAVYFAGQHVKNLKNWTRIEILRSKAHILDLKQVSSSKIIHKVPDI